MYRRSLGFWGYWVLAVATFGLIGTTLDDAPIVSAGPQPAESSVVETAQPPVVQASTGLVAGVPGFGEVGIASWYGGRHQGRLTASGEVFDENLLTAAHRTLPLETWARVTNLENGRSVEVKVNDRGPYIDGRVIDLSTRAAAELQMTVQGLAVVRIEALPEQTASAD
jgi:rare lipoprotein A